LLTPDPDAHYILTHNIFQNFAYTRDAKLVGERIYDDPGSYHYERLEATDVITPDDARRALAPYHRRAVVLHRADTWVPATIRSGGHA
jgi:hypothetical protein